jgi:hypothetical protein
MSSAKTTRNGFSEKIRQANDTHAKEVCSDLVSKTLVAETWSAPNTYRGSIVPV